MKKSTQLFVCKFCYREKPTLQGICSHISQSPLCRQAQHAKLSAGCTVDIPAKDTPELPSGLNEANIPLPEFDPPKFNAAQFLASEPEQNCGEISYPSKCTCIKESVDEKYRGILKWPWVEPCSGAGAEKQEPPWAPFDSWDEWELARWLLTSGLTQKAIDDFLKLHIVSRACIRKDETTHMSLHMSDPGPYAPIIPKQRNPVKCIKELIGNPEFREHMKYTPEHLYCDPEGKQWLYENIRDKSAWPCLIACCCENLCPKCCVAWDQREGTMHWPICILEAASQGASPDLPHANIFHSLRPDILHQLHKGVFKDHIVLWATICTEGGKLEVDRHFRAMPKHPKLRHFKKGILPVSQWTRTKYKNMEKVFLSVLSVRAVLDFIYYAHFEVHLDDLLKQLEDAWNTFHHFKHIFCHLIQHYVTLIRELRTADGYNTEGSERLHIEFTKTAYNFSNKKGYTSQMAMWLQHQKAAHRQDNYIYEDFDDSKSDSEPEDEQSPQASYKAPSQAKEEKQLANGFKIAKKPAYVHAKVSELVKDFGAIDFTCCLKDRLHQLAGPSSRRRTGNMSLIIENLSVAIYMQFKVKLPHIPQVSLILKTTMDTIHAHPAQAATAAHFSMVLACDPALNHGTESENPPGRHSQNLLMHHVAQVDVIFKLSEAICYIAGISLNHAMLPLAYVKWFTPFNTHDRHRWFASIISITNMIRSCHLIFVWGTSIDRTWSSDTVVELYKKFHFNLYLCHHDFVEFQYLVDRDEL
ncbi:hypothetical protein OBBRIDRAFT_815665 [Obba rivulosa]|uniref:Uncharacterized protein n=1 Tax=Obba rivulosa TaxID=1052685 RepID=A0A8E2DFL3_9APHY|nr:hypothetical protein OBBRIDRAFT_815665 [Obba rivulosa]